MLHNIRVRDFVLICGLLEPEYESFKDSIGQYWTVLDSIVRPGDPVEGPGTQLFQDGAQLDNETIENKPKQ